MWKQLFTTNLSLQPLKKKIVLQLICHFNPWKKKCVTLNMIVSKLGALRGNGNVNFNGEKVGTTTFQILPR